MGNKNAWDEGAYDMSQLNQTWATAQQVGQAQPIDFSGTPGYQPAYPVSPRDLSSDQIAEIIGNAVAGTRNGKIRDTHLQVELGLDNMTFTNGLAMAVKLKKVERRGSTLRPGKNAGIDTRSGSGSGFFTAINAGRK